MKIKTSPLENRILLLVFLVLANPAIKMAMNYIAWLQGHTAKYFIMLTRKFGHLIYFHISTYVAVAISQIFWPLLTYGTADEGISKSRVILLGS